MSTALHHPHGIQQPVSANWDLPTVHPVYFRLCMQTLRGEGVDVAPLLVDAGLGSWGELMRRTEPLSYRVVHRVIQLVLALGLKPSLPLDFGASIPASAHGPMGFAIVSSQDLRQALKTLERYTSLRSANFKYSFRESGDAFSFELVDLIDRSAFVPERDFFYALMFSLIVRMLEAVIDSQVRTLHIDLPLAQPDWHEEFTRYFAGVLQFDAGSLVIKGDAKLLDAPCATADPDAYAKACLDCDRLLANARNSSLHQQIAALLNSQNGVFPSLEEVAAYLHLSTRTLARRLSAEGTSFQLLLDEVRKQKAQWYLEQTRLKIEDIALRLGYANVSSFSRVCRRWFDRYPSELRR